MSQSKYSRDGRIIIKYIDTPTHTHTHTHTHTYIRNDPQVVNFVTM